MKITHIFRQVFAAVLLVLLSPLMIFAIILIKLDSRGEAIFKQTRIGKGLRPFTIYKLRTMTAHPSQAKNALFGDKEEYVTRIGRILRVLKIDETPQLINILKNEMRFIGPRPLRSKLHDHYVEYIPGFESRYATLPGIIGLSQIFDPHNEDREVGLACDLYYIDHESLKLNVQIAIYTSFYLLHSIFDRIYSGLRQQLKDNIEPYTLFNSPTHQTADIQTNVFNLPLEVGNAHSD